MFKPAFKTVCTCRKFKTILNNGFECLGYRVLVHVKH